MVLDTLLGGIFAAGSLVLWGMLSRKMKEIKNIPDHVLVSQLHENPQRIQMFALHLFNFRFFYREGRYQEKFWIIIAKMLYKIHIFLLKSDNVLTRLIKRAKVVRETPPGVVAPDPEYWKTLNPNLTTLPENRPVTTGMQDFRVRRKHRVVETTRL